MISANIEISLHSDLNTEMKPLMISANIQISLHSDLNTKMKP